jgi:serine/threonine-protein kinase
VPGAADEVSRFLFEELVLTRGDTPRFVALRAARMRRARLAGEGHDIGEEPQVWPGLLVVLGEGGTSVVYTASDETGGRSVALKVLRPLVSALPGAADAFRLVALRLAGLDHPNIARVVDWGADGLLDYMAAQRLDGASLADLLAEGPDGPRHELLPALRGVAAALAAAHAAGIVHGDVKPGNVMVEAMGHARLIDFTAVAPIAREGAPALPGFGGVSPRFASCELISGRPACAADDVFALAVTTYRVLAGEHPFAGHDALTASRLGIAPQRPEGMTSRAWTVLRSALAFDEAERPASATAFAGAVLRAPWQRRLAVPWFARRRQ